MSIHSNVLNKKKFILIFDYCDIDTQFLVYRSVLHRLLSETPPWRGFRVMDEWLDEKMTNERSDCLMN